MATPAELRMTVKKYKHLKGLAELSFTAKRRQAQAYPRGELAQQRL